MASSATIETDYLIVGAGAVGMAFADTLISESDVQVTIVDRKHAPGGHWNEAYPYVRLHQPSAYYGVNSLSLGEDGIDPAVTSEGQYERAGVAQICGYYDRVLRERLLPSGRVRYLPMCDYQGNGQAVSLVSGQTYLINARRKRVDATYQQPSVPATTRPRFEVAAGVRCVPAGALAELAEPAAGYVVIGAGKTGIDACLWLLDQAVPAEKIRWIKPREAWLLNRAYMQPRDQVASLVEGAALQMEAVLAAATIDQVFAELEAREQLLRVERTVEPTMFKGGSVNNHELEQLRRIEHVVRLGRVRRIERERIVLDQGTIASSCDQVYVHCSASALNLAPAMPIFQDQLITPQTLRIGLPHFSAALIAHIELTRDSNEEKNRLCPPNPLCDTPMDWLRMTLTAMNADYLWGRDPELRQWLDGARLNASAGMRSRKDDPRLAAATQRYAKVAAAGSQRLAEFMAQRGH